MPLAKNIRGLRFGRLVAVRPTGKSNSGGRIWLCQCDCGLTAQTTVGYLNIGKTRSCGCLQKETVRAFVKSRRKPDAAFRRLFQDYAGNAKKGRREFSLTEKRFREITSSLCEYCGASPAQVKKVSGEVYLYNGIDRVNSLAGYEESNCAPCCWTCNQMKSTFGVAKFLDSVEKISAYQTQKESR